MKNFQKIPKNTSSCNESNGIKFSQKFVHLVIRSFSIVCGDLKLNQKRKRKKMGRPIKAHQSNRSNRPVNRLHGSFWIWIWIQTGQTDR